MSEEVTLGEILDVALARALAGVHVSIPGVVKSYDPSTQRATIAPAVKKPRFNDDAVLVYESFPDLEDVPVLWPRAGQAALHGELVAGDSVDLLFQDQSIGEWRASGTPGAEPADARRLSFGYPVAIPGLYPDGKPLTGPAPGFSVGFQGAGNLGTVLFTESSVQVGRGTGQALVLKSDLVALIGLISSAIGATGAPGSTAAKAAFDAAVALPASGPVYSTIAKGV